MDGVKKVVDMEKNALKDAVKVFEKIRIPFLLFITYSFLGWLFEVGVFYANEHQFINRGFLIGPWCSIYGYGCLIITYGLKKYRKNPIKLFCISAIVCSVFEYLVSYGMEVLFGGRWWDYGQDSFQLNGRVWLMTSLLFAFLVCLIVNYLRPFLLKRLRKIPKKVLLIVCGVLLFVYVADVVISLAAVVNLGVRLKTFEQDVTKQVSEYIFSKVKSLFGI